MKALRINGVIDGDTVKVINRIDPCKCGCKGQDSQHLRSYDRKIHGMTYTDYPTRVKAYDNALMTIDARAYVTMPWSDMRVAVVRVWLNRVALGWFVERL